MNRVWTNDQLDNLLGGKWAVSMRAVIIASPAVILLGPIGNSVDQTNFPWLNWIFVSALSMMPSLALYALFGITIYRHRNVKPLPWWLIFIMGGFLGAIKGGLMAYIAYKIGLDTAPLGQSVWHKTLNHFFVGVTFFAFITFILASYDRYTIQRNRLLRQALSQNSFPVGINTRTTVNQSETQWKVINRIESALDETRINLEEMTNTSERVDPYRVAQYLRQQSATAIRPLSHKMWDSNLVESGWRRTLGAFQWSLRTIQVHTPLIVLAYTLTSITPFYRSGPVLEATKLFVTHIFFLAIYLLLVNRLLPRINPRSEYSRALFLCISAGLFEYAVDLICSKITTFELGSLTYFGEWAWIIFLIYAISSFKSILSHDEEFLDKLQSVLTDSEKRVAGIRLNSATTSREIAQYLHSHLQSSLLTSANLIEQAAELGDDELIFKEIERIKSQIRLPSASELNQPASSLEAAVNRSKGNWDGLMTIRTKISGNAKTLQGNELHNLERVLDEAFSNAFRHGAAQNVTVEIEADRAALKVTVTDDGSGPNGGIEGMGSQTFDTIAGSHWLLEAEPKKGTKLSLTILR